MKTKLLKSLKFIAGASFLFALVLNVIVTLDDPFMFMSEVAIAQGTTQTSNSSGSDSGVPGGLLPGFDEMSRACAIPIGGGGEFGIDYSLTPEGVFTISYGGKYYRPSSVLPGHELKCTWAWATCSSGDCIPDQNNNTTN